MRGAIAGAALALALACHASPATAQQPGSPAAAREDASKVGMRTRPATALRTGDAVTVGYVDRDGKIVAQNVTVNTR